MQDPCPHVPFLFTTRYLPVYPLLARSPLCVCVCVCGVEGGRGGRRKRKQEEEEATLANWLESHRGQTLSPAFAARTPYMMLTDENCISALARAVRPRGASHVIASLTLEGCTDGCNYR